MCFVAKKTHYIYNINAKEDKKMETNELMKKRRLELGLTLEQVGDYVGVGKSTVRKWESGLIKNMRRDKIGKLAEVLKLSPIELMKGYYESNTLSSQWGDDRSNREHLSDKPELLDLYDEIRNRQEMYILFDKVRDLDPKDVESILAVVQTIRKAKGFEE